jgi:hypothetical protein
LEGERFDRINRIIQDLQAWSEVGGRGGDLIFNIQYSNSIFKWGGGTAVLTGLQDLQD